MDFDVFFQYRISIHALARRATQDPGQAGKSQANFNPRSRKESDVFHALDEFRHLDFNPRSRKESDKVIPAAPPPLHDFNPRSRKESDIKMRKFYKVFGNFNPRSRKESDSPPSRSFPTEKKFQSTLSQGERRTYRQFVFDIRRISIHALARRATHLRTICF